MRLVTDCNVEKKNRPTNSCLRGRDIPNWSRSLRWIRIHKGIAEYKRWVCGLDSPARHLDDSRVASPERVNLDAVIFGGGAAGLWSLDLLTRAGLRVLLLESTALGAGQTIAAQGIIHGGVKYTLDGVFSDSAKAIAAMPSLWRECLGQSRMPYLGRTTLRADWCALWRTSDVRSQLGMIGARAALQVRPVKLERKDRPEPLIECPGEVYRLDEPVIDPATLLADLAERHGARILRYDPNAGIEFVTTSGTVTAIHLAHSGGGSNLDLRPAAVVLTAGEGNGQLRQRVGLAASTMQLRPLHMVLVRGDLPVLNGHCTDGAKTRVTITSAVDGSGRAVWQVGGQIAEDGVAMEQRVLVEHARSELAAVLPRLPDAIEWSTYRVNRAEAALGGGKRPSDVFCEREGNVITAWPTKLALVPRLADRIAALVACPTGTPEWRPNVPPDWPRPVVALPPWEKDVEWIRDR